jgi:hypothetical protein
MIVRALDVNGDWCFGKGQNDYKRNQDQIMQTIKTRLMSFLGDCFFATNAGIDWFNLMGAKNKLALELAVRSVILNTAGVLRFRGVPSITLDPRTRLVSMQFVVETIFTTNAVSPLSLQTSFILTESGDVLNTESGLPIVGG